ncbi:MAG: phosphate acetyltransferase [Porphyromonas sp.]|nr:phosphate acetyltransferase [Porphyromonas sp.]
MELLESFVKRASADRRRIVLPEGVEERTLKAADRLIKDGVANIILIGDEREIANKAAELSLTHIAQAEIVNPATDSRMSKYANLLFELRKSKGMTIEEAEKKSKDPLYLACLMIKAGDADGEVAGAKNFTGDVLRPALQIIKTVPGVSTVSGAFIMITPAKEYGKEGTLLFADCAVTPNPDAQQLAQIAISSAHTAKDLLDMEAKVAILSFSTKGSAKNELVDKVIEATKIANEAAPELSIDGELQADAALVPKVGELKAPNSPIAGHANVLVFPSLEVGNIAYKLVQRLAGAEAVGPVLQGIAAPVNDLSRGCSVEDIYYMVAITALQAIGLKGAK